MALILTIDTALENATIAVSNNQGVLKLLNNAVPKTHAGFVQAAIKQLLIDCGLTMRELEAIAVTAGPGSYTGLRVGMASAKGLCYALNLPLIAINTLEAMAITAMQEKTGTSAFLYCPMIDAGRMEVYTAIYDEKLQQILKPSAIILEPGIFDIFIQDKQVMYSGTGFEKFRTISPGAALKYTNKSISAEALAFLAFEAFKKKNFASLPHAEPLYLKQFYSPATVIKT